MSRISVHSSRRAFTLIELMVAVSLCAIVFAGILSAYLFVGRNLTRLVNVQQQEVQVRRTLRTFTQDLSAARELTTMTSSQITLSKPASATITFRYSIDPSENRAMSLMVNGTVVNSNLAFPQTGAWTTWNTQSIVVNLNAGSNAIRVTAVTSKGGPMLDKIDVTGAGTYQAETATIWHGVSESTYAGYTGTGYVNYDNEIGSYVQWIVSGANVPAPTVTYTYVPPSPSTAANGTLTRTETIPPAAAKTLTMLSGLSTFTFNYYNTGGIAVTSSPQSVKTAEFTFTSSAGSATSGTLTQYTTASPRVLLRNKPVLE